MAGLLSGNSFNGGNGGVDAKEAARGILVGGSGGPGAPGHSRGPSTGAGFFVPADSESGTPDPQLLSRIPDNGDEEDEEEAVSLMNLLVEYMSLAFLVKGRMDPNQQGQSQSQQNVGNGGIIGCFG